VWKRGSKRSERTGAFVSCLWIGPGPGCECSREYPEKGFVKTVWTGRSAGNAGGCAVRWLRSRRLQGDGECHIDLIPTSLFGGISLFDHLGIAPVDLQILEVNATAQAVHLTFRVLKEIART
jgi:hypothetical protein